MSASPAPNKPRRNGRRARRLPRRSAPCRVPARRTPPRRKGRPRAPRRPLSPATQAAPAAERGRAVTIGRPLHEKGRPAPRQGPPRPSRNPSTFLPARTARFPARTIRIPGGDFPGGHADALFTLATTEDVPRILEGCVHFIFIAEILPIALFATYHHFQLPRPLPATSSKQLKTISDFCKNTSTVRKTEIVAWLKYSKYFGFPAVNHIKVNSI